MMFKTKYDLTLNEVSLIFERGDISLLKRSRWVPRFMVQRYYKSFVLDFTEMFNGREVSDLLNQDMMRFKIENRVNLILHPLYIGLLISDHPGFRKTYQDLFGRPYNNEQDLKAIISEIDRLKGKIKEMGTPEKTVQGLGKISFEEVITYVEMVLDRSMDRNMMLYQFKYQYDLAVKRAHELEKISKRNG